MTHLQPSPSSKQLGKAARVPCAYKREPNLIGKYLQGVPRCSYPERLVGRLAHPIIGTKRCIVAPRSQKTRVLLESIVAKLCIRVVKGT